MRYHGELARIELAPKEIERMLDPSIRAAIVRKVRKSLTQAALVTYEKKVLPQPSGVRFWTEDQEYRYPNGAIIALAGLDDPEKVKSTDPDKVIDALPGIEAPNLTGGTSKMLPNHHITKPVYIGEVRADGQFDVVWKTPNLVPGEAWSKYLPGSKDLEADWVTLKCGNYNTVTKKCGGAS